MNPLIVLLSVFSLGILLKTLSKKSNIQLAFLGKLAMSSMLLFTGIAHFTFTEGMIQMLPESIPFRLGIIHATGILEILGAIGLLVNKVSKWTGILLILFFFAVLPANIYAALNHINPTTGALDGAGPSYLFFRIPLQLFFIAWIYRFAVASDKIQNLIIKKIFPMKKLKNTMPLFIIILFSMMNLSAFAQLKTSSSNISENAKTYIDAYVNMQFEDLAEFYAKTSIFQDPTLEIISEDAAQIVIGKEAIIEKLKRNFNGITEQHYELTQAYSVGNYSIFVGIYNYVQNATAFGGPDLKIYFSLKSTTILKESKDSIIEHKEYMDYASWFEQYETQKNSKK